ncbi:ecto-ADP-ribosyltransferase 5 [Ornithorhynchus anatinus]|uniref:NAD(P)(+)--arginine ADP-ribosyltransferase n=1 Tax=Ornithorhynchus anatinus TaxID=9258 RepID=F6TNG2_ORNAN|nr:ecto-ADP-ribosyltransferase 5 [Ornithorhynchus anatinus]XP_028906364.1 ecto-ADP-ribosyltransferase 5 [Ornithorhynchus anatinus]
MWGALLTAQSYLYLPALLFLQAQALQTVSLGLAPGAFDDAYVGCVGEMEADVAPRLLREESARHPALKESWEAAATAWAARKAALSLPPGFRDAHGVAVLVYTNASTALYRELNAAVRTGGGSRRHYLAHFPFKALHFYLTRALQLLGAGAGCPVSPGRAVFRGVGGLRFEPPGLGASVRFGQFTSSSEAEMVARGFGTDTFFHLGTCFGASLGPLSAAPWEREVLIPAHEVFRVANFSRNGERSLMTLKSTGQTCSHFNCAYLGGEKQQDCVFVSGGEGNQLAQDPGTLLPMRTLLLPPGGLQLTDFGQEA